MGAAADPQWLGPLTWWTDTHNSHANREVVDLLYLEFGCLEQETIADLAGGLRAGACFLYRYLVDMKLQETRPDITRTGCRPKEAIQEVLGLDVRAR